MAFLDTELYSYFISPEGFPSRVPIIRGTKDPNDKDNPADTPIDFTFYLNTTTKEVWSYNLVESKWVRGIGSSGNITAISTDTQIEKSAVYFCDVSTSKINLIFPTDVTYSSGEYFELLISKGDSTVNNVVIDFGDFNLQSNPTSTFTMDIDGYFRFMFVDDVIGFKIIPIDLNGIIGGINVIRTKTSSFTVDNNETYLVDSTYGVITVSLPTNIAYPYEFTIIDLKNTFSKNKCIVDFASVGYKLEGVSVSFSMNNDGNIYRFVATDSLYGFKKINLTQSNSNIIYVNKVYGNDFERNFTKLPTVSGNYIFTKKFPWDSELHNVNTFNDIYSLVGTTWTKLTTYNASPPFIIVGTSNSDRVIWRKQNETWVSSVDSSHLVGEVKSMATMTVPSGWFLCNGQAISRSFYPELMNAITFTGSVSTPTNGTLITCPDTSNLYVGLTIEFSSDSNSYAITAINSSTTYTIDRVFGGMSGSQTAKYFPFGDGDRVNTFNVPNYNGRVLVGRDGTTEFRGLGKTGGAKTHTLTISEMPSHDHTYGNTGGIQYTNDGWGEKQSSTDEVPTSETTNKTGGGQAHNNLQPYSTVFYIIKA
jgi:microcystin-dependent protein